MATPKHVLDLINKAYEEKAEFLDLGNCGLREVPEELLILQDNLTYLNLGSSFRIGIDEVIGGENGYSGNHFLNSKSVIILSELKNLNGIGLCNIGITPIILKSISRLENLTTLDLAGNRIVDKDLKHIFSLSSLTFLDLSDNYIVGHGLKNIFKLKKLKYLNLSVNKISLEITDYLLNLKDLTFVNLTNNFIEVIRRDFIVAHDLNLSTSLSDDYLDNTIYLGGNPLFIPPISILNEGRDFVLEWFNSRGKTKLNELKLLLVGWGEVGKTSLMNAFLGRPHNDNEETTHDVNKICWDTDLTNIDEEKYKINLWDFGGQHVKHHLHQYFFSGDSLYLLLLNDRTQYPPEYWMEMISQLAADSPVMIVFTKADLSSNQQWQQDTYNKLKAEYPNQIVDGYLAVDAKSRYNIPELKSKIETLLRSGRIKGLNDEYGKSWLELKDWLESETRIGKNYLGYDAYAEKAKEKGLSENGADKFAEVLHQIGTITYLKNVPSAQILNPDWLTQGAYYLMESERAASKMGILTEADIELILNEESAKKPLQYKSQRERMLLLEFMKTRDLIFYREEDQRWLLPSAFQSATPGNSVLFLKDRQNLKEYRLQFTRDVSDNIILRFITRNLKFALDHQWWREGVLMQIGKTECLVQLSKLDRRIEIFFSGKNFRDAWMHIRKDLADILDMYKGLGREFQIVEWNKKNEPIAIGEDELYECYLDNVFEIPYYPGLGRKVDVTASLGLLGFQKVQINDRVVSSNMAELKAPGFINYGLVYMADNMRIDYGIEFPGTELKVLAHTMMEIGKEIKEGQLELKAGIIELGNILQEMDEKLPEEELKTKASSLVRVFENVNKTVATASLPKKIFDLWDNAQSAYETAKPYLDSL